MKYTFDFISEVFHGDMFADMADVAITTAYPKPEQLARMWQSGCVIYCKTDYIGVMFQVLRDILESNPEQKYVIITHNSDHAIDENHMWMTPNVNAWYAANVDFSHPRLIPLPLGMERPNGQGYSAHPGVLHMVRQTPRTIKNLCYMNHSNTTNRFKRLACTDALKDMPWITREEKVPFDQFIRGLWSHPFILSPEGNGIDCLRTWEALWMDCIPICMRSIHMEAFTDLPILLIDDWAEVTEDLLKRTLTDYESREWDYSKLTFSYWKKRIHDSL